MRSLSRRSSAFHLIPLSVFVFDAVTSTTLSCDDLDDTIKKPKGSYLKTQSPKKTKSFKIGELEIMKMICALQAFAPETATDQEIIDAILGEVEKIKQFPGGRLTFSIEEAERHIKNAENKRTLKHSLNECFKNFPKSFQLNFDLKAFELDPPALQTESILITSESIAEEENKENKRSFKRKRINEVLISPNSKIQKKSEIKQNDDEQERHVRRTPWCLVLSSQNHPLSVVNFAKEARSSKMRTMGISPFGGDNNSGGSNSSRNLTHSNSSSSVIPFWFYEETKASNEISINSMDEGKSPHSFVSPYFLSYYQFPDFKMETPKQIKPETLIARTWMKVSQFWKYYPHLCLMAGMGLLSILNILLSQPFYLRRRLFSNFRPLRIEKIRMMNSSR